MADVKLSYVDVKNQFGLRVQTKDSKPPEKKAGSISNAEIEKEIFKEQAADDEKLIEEIMGVIGNEDPFPTVKSVNSEDEEEDGPSVPDDVRINVKFILFDL